jgi:TP901 family phage tail tape measure protein
MAETEELGLEVFVEGWQQFERIMGRLDKSVDGLEKEMKSTTKTSGAFSVAVGNLAAGAVMKLGDVLVDSGRKVVDFTMDSIEMAADFQDSMAVLSIAASSTGLTFDELKAAALAVGGDTRLLGVSATGAAESLTGLFKAGLTGTEIFGDLNAFMNEGAELGGALRASIDLAAATELDMVQASDLAAIALASFGAELETEAERAGFINDAMNNMVKAADASVAEVSGLAEALKMVGATAGGMGIDITDVNNALAILSTRGIQGSMAGTSLNRMLLDLTKTTDEATEMMEELGINVFDMEGNLLPLVDIVGQFETALGGATDAEKAAALQAIFTAQGQRAINTLMTEGAAGWNEMAAATEAAAGIQEQAEIRAGTFNAKMEALEGTIETVKIGIGDAFLPVATDLAKWFADMVGTHGPQLAEWLGVNLPIAIEAAKVFFMDELLPALTDVWDFTVNNLIPTIRDVTTWLGENIPPAIATAKEYWENVLRPALETVWLFIQDNVIPVLETVWNWLAVNIPIAVETVRMWWEETLLPALETVWLFIQDNVIPIIETVVEWLEINIPLAIENARMAWEEILKPALEMVWEFIKDNLFPLIEALVEFFDVAFTLAVTAMSGLWENVLEPAIRKVWDFIKIYALPIFEALEKFWTETLKPTIEVIAKLLGETLKTAWEDFTTVVDWAKTNILEPVKGTFDAIAGAVQSVIGWIKDLTEKLKNITLPDWLTPGSPTPFEIGLRGIADAMQQVQALSGQVFAGMPSSIMVGAAGVSPTASPGTQVTNNVTNEGDRNEFNFNAQSLMQPGQMAMEFSTMAMRSR